MPASPLAAPKDPPVALSDMVRTHAQGMKCEAEDVYWFIGTDSFVLVCFAKRVEESLWQAVGCVTNAVITNAVIIG